MHRPPDDPRKPTVLYVEDYPANVVLMEALFLQRPWLALVVATTGEEALTLARGLNPVLLLLDLHLPDCHGSELLHGLRKLPGCEGPPAVAVTAEQHFQIEGTGFSELWTKPLDLLGTLARLDCLTEGDWRAPQASSPWRTA